MPRKSAASLSVAPLDISTRRVRPPADLSEPIRKIWSDLVDSLPGDRFHNSDRPLLALYCRFLHQANVALANVELHGASDGVNHNPWLKTADVATRRCAALATKLRLCPLSRMDRKVAGPAAREDHDGPKPWDRHKPKE